MSTCSQLASSRYIKLGRAGARGGILLEPVEGSDLVGLGKNGSFPRIPPAFRVHVTCQVVFEAYLFIGMWIGRKAEWTLKVVSIIFDIRILIYIIMYGHIIHSHRALVLSVSV